ncbi:MAG: hypothetical protein PF487_13020, partial [Bacteroidales bacterium]|nr:hypothetical protein [Bacteroidales bacterium]
NRTVINEIFGGNKFIEPFFFNSVSFKGFQSVKYFLYSHNLSMPRPQNVLVAGIYCAILAKFKRIELFGAEHSWIKYLSVNDVCEVCIEDRHFYDKEKVTRQTWNSTHDGDTKLHVILRAFAYMFESYWELQKFSEQQNVEIVNYSKESFIDAFKKNLN